MATTTFKTNGNTLGFHKAVEEFIESLGKHVVHKSEFKYHNGETLQTRIAISVSGQLMRMAKGKSRRGYVLTLSELDRISEIKVTVPNTKDMSAAQRYAADLVKQANYIRRNRMAPVWPDMVEKFESMIDEKLEILRQFAGDSHEAWQLAGKLGLPQISYHKTTTLKSCGCPAYIMADIAANWGKPFRHHWHGDYDYRVSAEIGDDGVYRAWLSQEYKGCGNGHYWDLINPTHAIFGEDD